ncbi:glycoside hydrolase family 19 protein [Burkholderia ambifaria]|uniref:glycoside hydrolase family 19 protein n=1 Tax=Burkholderia ambifaria TaxID=152480 RepID=UPI00158B76E5|nr:glycoside hydrolase family 19 protein [Burkholderia ambifaria]
MSNLRSDSRGFLIADRPLRVDDLADGIDGVRSDTSAILALLKSRGRAARLAEARVNSSSVSRAPATQRERDAQGRFLPSRAAALRADLSPVVHAVDQLTRQQAKKLGEDRRAEASRANRTGGTATPPLANQRDGRGRFVAGAGGKSGTDDDETEKRLLSRVRTWFKDRASSLTSSSEIDKVDPAIEATKEIGRLARAPAALATTAVKATIGRAFNPNRGRDRADSGWLIRIWSELRLSRRQTGVMEQAQTRILKSIDKKSGTRQGGIIQRVAGAVTSPFRRGFPFSGGGRRGGYQYPGRVPGRPRRGGPPRGFAGGAKNLAKGLLRRIPFLGALIAGGSALASLFGDDDPNLTPEQNRANRFGGVGSGVGALAGGAVGALFGGPFGAMIGGVIGDRIGEIAGEWLATVDMSQLPKALTERWNTFISYARDGWNTVVKAISQGFGSVFTTLGKGWDSIVNGAKTFLKEKFGIDVDKVIGTVKEVADSAAAAAKPVVDAAKAVGEKVVETVKPAADKAKEIVSNAVEAAKDVTQKAVDTAKDFVGKGPKANRRALEQAMFDANITNPTEQAMFLAQMSHESGGFRSLRENIKGYSAKTFLKLFGKRAGITTLAQAKAIRGQGEEAMAEKMYGGAWGKKNLGNTEQGDGYKFRGRGFVQITGRANYAAASRALGIDLIKNPELAEDPVIAGRIATWYWQSRKGLAEAGRRGDVKAATKGVNGGLNGVEARDSEYKKYLAVTTAPGYLDSRRVAQIDTQQFAKSSALSSVGQPVPTPTARGYDLSSATSKFAFSVPQLPMRGALPALPEISIPAPLSSPAPVRVTLIRDQQIGQDVSDRRIAHIATGGISE